MSCISLKLARTRPQLQEILGKTLLAVQQQKLGVQLKKLTDEVIIRLFKIGALEAPSKKKGLSSSVGSSDLSVKMDTSVSF